MAEAYGIPVNNPAGQINRARPNGGTLDDLLSNKAATDVARPATEVEKAYSRIQMGNERLRQLLDVLEAKLACVMAPMPPKERANPNDTRPGCSGLVNGLHHLADDQEDSTTRIAVLLDRLEL